MPHRHVGAEGGEIERRDRGGHGIRIHGVDPQPEGGESQGVPADAAAEVGDAGDSGVAEASRMPCRDLPPRRLLEPRPREQHPVGELAELGACAGTKRGLPDDRRDEGGRIPAARSRETARATSVVVPTGSSSSSSASPSAVSSASSSAISTAQPTAPLSSRRERVGARIGTRVA